MPTNNNQMASLILSSMWNILKNGANLRENLRIPILRNRNCYFNTNIEKFQMQELPEYLTPMIFVEDIHKKLMMNSKINN